MLRDEKILITGPAGRIASALARSLAPENEVWGIARFSDPAGRERVEQLGVTTRTVDLAEADYGDLPSDFTYVLHIAADFSATDYERAFRVNAEGTGLLLHHCRNAKAALVMSTVSLYKPHPDPWHPFREDDPVGDAMIPNQLPYSVSKIAEEGVARYCARAYDLPTTITRMGLAYGEQGGLASWHMQAIADGQPVHTRWDPMPYSPIHDDDICGQLEALLDAATVPTTIVNWAGDEPASVQEWTAYFGELFGVDPVIEVNVVPGASVGSVADHHTRASITGRCTVSWRDGFRRMAEQFVPDRIPRVSRRFPTCDTLLESAAAQAQLDDFGPGDFREGLEVLLDSLERDSDVSDQGADAVTRDLRRRLVNRLEVEAWYGEHPEVDDTPVTRIVDINGLPRSGTTALANLLSLEPQFRCLRGWEQAQPCPPPVLDEEDTDPRRVRALAGQAQQSAQMKAMHLFAVDATMEDTELLGMAFHGQQYTLPVYGYHEWWRGCDMADAFAFHRRVVTLLHSRRPPYQWLFKAPHHNFHLEAIAAAYPDARFVMTHRDPVRAVPSWVSLVSAILPSSNTNERDLHRLGTEASNHLRVGVERAMRERAVVGEERVLDVHHRQFVADPWGTVDRIYDFLGMDLEPAVDRAFRDWHAENRTGVHGTHHYTAEQFGLADDQLRSDFAFYTDHFDIDLEHP